jgi:N-acetylglutamate synthase-like GNAT family acetyltransferase
MTDAAVEIEGGLERLDVEFIYELLRQTHWARNRPRDVFERAIKHSLCFGAYEGKRQVGFARVVTDHATFGYVQDFIVDPKWRGRGIGRSLLACVMEDPVVSSLRTLLLRTETAHGLYQKAGFALAPNPQDLMARYRGDLQARPTENTGRIRGCR